MQFLRDQFVDRNELNAAAALERVLVSEAKLERAEEEAAKTAFIARGAAQRFIFKQVLKEGLREVVNGVAFAPNIGIDRTPIDAAKFRQRRLRSRVGLGASGKNDAPRSFLKTFLGLFPSCHIEHVAILRTNAESWQERGPQRWLARLGSNRPRRSIRVVFVAIRLRINLERAWEKRHCVVGIVRDVNRVSQRIHRCHHGVAAHSFVHDFDVAIVDVPCSAGVSIQFCHIVIAGDWDVNEMPLLIDRDVAPQDILPKVSGAGWERTHNNSRRRRLRTTRS
ncbi:MAG: hypothetical protein QOI22_1359, partial [Verrucomicrobiota bacterium]